jgi:enoyl-CoA hydratase
MGEIMDEKVKMTIDEGVAIVRLNRPEAANALNVELLELLTEFFKNLRDDASVRGIVLTGEGKHFCAGADIARMSEMDGDAIKTFIEKGQELMLAIERAGKPVIAAVNGHAAGGGLELALACDYIVAAESAVFAAPEVKLGIIPGFGGTQRLSRTIGRARAKEMIFTGMGVPARVACAIGLVNTIYPDKTLLEGAVGVMKDICAFSPVSLRHAKEVIDAGADTDLESACRLELDAFVFCFDSEGRKEGMKAFLEKRKPNFKGE